MVASAPSDFTEMVNMGMRLEEGVGKDDYPRMKALLNDMGRLRRKMERHMLCNLILNLEDPLPRGSLCIMPAVSIRKKITFDPIPMSYAELYPSLIERKLITPRDPPAVPANPQWWYKPDQHCVYHSGAPGHNIENCYPLKTKVQDLVRCGILSFEDSGPNVTKNPLPEHGKSVNMVQGCPGKYKVKYIGLPPSAQRASRAIG
ncbi:hypothetical protein KIW84_021797 [Lathyrus oleraceus]|uniref:Uncharacterized protein n=1 Tax=Pisum sativum TaxID=3888 RepID=A0A9D4Y9I5_PEA|nr:hypothetical protein KIW84_021797 [Pisum sativum]